jgi:hypothetical protein
MKAVQCGAGTARLPIKFVDEDELAERMSGRRMTAAARAITDGPKCGMNLGIWEKIMPAC